jgi:exosortase A-associated hydrolase 2
VGGRRVFALIYGPPREDPAVARVLFVPPFAEEMNKARRMLALQARALARTGFAVLVPDLYGTGDSAGDFADATLELWKEDLRACADHLGGAAENLIVWAMRAGALLATDALNGGFLHASQLVLWQPVLSGEAFLNQFLRLKLAAGLQREGGASSTRELRQELEQAGSIEIAGYRLSSALAAGLGSLRLGELRARPPRGVVWLELGGSFGGSLGPASKRQTEAWRAAGVPLTWESVPGPQFWATQEIAEAPALIDRTCRALGR